MRQAPLAAAWVAPAGRLVPDEGRRDAPIAVIGEAPGRHEERTGRPFVGPAGQLLERWWRAAGWQRSDVYLTNVYPYRPPQNNLDAISRGNLERAAGDLRDRLAETKAVVLVPTGTIALRALMQRPLSGRDSPRITQWRGSIFGVRLGQRTVKAIGTIHPAAVLREPSFGRVCEQDWRRIVEETAFPELRLPEREHQIRPSLAQVEQFIAGVEAEIQAGRDPVLALDIETSDAGIRCLAFSYRPERSLTIPIGQSFWPNVDIWSRIRHLATLDCDKATHNGHYDAYWLLHEQVHLRRWRWDTLAMHHALDATDEHSLAYCGSVDTRQPFWKADHKDPAIIRRYGNALDALFSYCGVDACVTRELVDVYRQRLIAAGRLAFYIQHYQHLFRPLLDLMVGGLRLDEAGRRQRAAECESKCQAIQAQLTAAAGKPLHAKKDLSTRRIQWFLYDHLGLPRQRLRRSRAATTTANEVALRRLQLAHPAHREVIGQILDHRRLQTMARFLSESMTDADGYVRSTYKFTTESGRLAAAQTPMRTGLNVQNVDGAVRDLFHPDPGHVWLEVDLSQVESRFVYWLSGDPKLIEQANRPPSEWDMHTWNASVMFGKSVVEVTKSERALGKRLVHGAQRGMRGASIAEALLKDGIVLTPEECERLVEAYLDQHPGVADYFQIVRRRLLAEQRLVNSWGRVWDVRWERFNADLYRRAYSFLPQSECADWLNQYGLVPLWRWARQERVEGRLVAQIHDALLWSVKPDAVWSVARQSVACLEQQRGDWRVPATLRIGSTWGTMLDWPVRATPEKVRAVAWELARG